MTFVSHVNLPRRRIANKVLHVTTPLPLTMSPRTTVLSEAMHPSLGSKPRIGSNTVSIGVSKRPSVNGRGFTVSDCGFSSESQRDRCPSGDLTGDLVGPSLSLAQHPSPLSHASFFTTLQPAIAVQGKRMIPRGGATSELVELPLTLAVVVFCIQQGPLIRFGRDETDSASSYGGYGNSTRPFSRTSISALYS